MKRAPDDEALAPAATPKRERAGDEPSDLTRAPTVLLTPPSPARQLGFSASFVARADPLFGIVRPLVAGDRPLSLPLDKRRIKLFLVRHAESDANVDPMLHTHLSDHSIPLSDTGVQQADAVARFLSSCLQDSTPLRTRIITSPYKRARDTSARIIAACSGLVGDECENVLLGEQQFGLFEGLPVQSIAQTFPVECRYFEKAIASGGRFWARPPLGESRFDVCARVAQVIDRIVMDEHYANVNTVVVVSHGTTLRALAMMWLDRCFEWFEQEPNPANCSVRLLDGLNDCGYIYSGFRREAAPKPQAAAVPAAEPALEPAPPADDEEDVIDYTQRTMTSASLSQRTTSNAALLERLEALEAEIKEVRDALTRGDKKG